MKFIFKCIVALVCIALIALGIYVGYGYINYQSYNQENDLVALVEQVRSKEDYIEYEELPETLIRATVAIEDRRFFEHSGIDQW